MNETLLESINAKLDKLLGTSSAATPQFDKESIAEKVRASMDRKKLKRLAKGK